MAIRILILLLFACSLYADVKVEGGRISADLKSEPLTQVLDRLKTETNVKLFVDEGIAGKTVSANFQDLPVAMALKKILEGTGINYAVLAGADGEPQSVFIGGSTSLGSSPKRLDNRPVGNRGVVTPVPPPPPPPIPEPDGRQPVQPQIKPLTPGTVNVPTGGGFVPNQQKSDQPPEGEQQQQPQQLDENNDEE
ncbi:STN domain-containing protein [bacterium]|nr:STN domain-containing protein [bacterium]MCI0603270.1 STN domain-containing protein [bacterium]